MEGEQETAPKLSNGTSLNDLQWPFQRHDYSTPNNLKMVQHTAIYLQWPTNRKSYMIYRTAPFSMTSNDPYPQFQGHAILWRWIHHKRYDIQTQFQWNTNSDLHTPYLTVSFRMTLNDLERLSKIFNDTKWRAVSATAELIDILNFVDIASEMAAYWSYMQLIKKINNSARLLKS